MNSLFMMEANELILVILEDDADAQPVGITSEVINVGTEMLDASCALSNIRYLQDMSLLNEARKKLEGMIDWFYKEYDFPVKPRTYRRVAHKAYLDFAKSKRPNAKKIRATVRKQLGYVRRDLGYLDHYMLEATPSQISWSTSI